MAKQRIGYLDIAKGIGILLMIFGYIDRVGVVQTWIYSFHAPLFFIVSGIIVFKQNKRNIKKVKGLLYPYFMFSLITIIYIFISELIMHHDILQILIQVKDCFF